MARSNWRTASAVSVATLTSLVLACPPRPPQPPPTTSSTSTTTIPEPVRVTVSGRGFFVDGEPVRQFTLFAAGLRDEATLTSLFRQARALGYNNARVGSETADWFAGPVAR